MALVARRLALPLAFVAGLVPALAAAGPAQDRSLRSGLYGHATKGPLTPVCREGVPCDGPAGSARLLIVRGARLVAQTRTDASGKYRIRLRPGRYTVKSKIGFGVVKPSTVTVPHGRFARVDLFVDTGIR
ncbi:MAG TPA: carboxypeptidase-like regulatory domain-containing protein [Gaiellaceae bacterium]